MSNSKKLDTLLEKAKGSVSKTKQNVTGLDAKNGDYHIIPGFSDYALSKKDQVFSRKTDKIQQIPKGKKKYLIFNDKGERRSISLVEIKAKITEVFGKKTDKPKGEKSDSKKTQILALHKEGKTAKEISEELGFKYNSVYITIKVHTIKELNKKGLTPKQISEKTGFSEDSIIWQINK